MSCSSSREKWERIDHALDRKRCHIAVLPGWSIDDRSILQIFLGRKNRGLCGYHPHQRCLLQSRQFNVSLPQLEDFEQTCVMRLQSNDPSACWDAFAQRPCRAALVPSVSGQSKASDFSKHTGPLQWVTYHAKSCDPRIAEARTNDERYVFRAQLPAEFSKK